MLVPAEDIGIKLCGILGIDTKCVRKVTIELEADKLAIVTVERYLQRSETDELLLEFEQFQIAEKSLVNTKLESMRILVS